MPVEVEVLWLCDYPEFNDEACMVDHEPKLTAQPRKHTGCGWYRCERVES